MPAPFMPAYRKDPIPSGTGSNRLVAGTGFEPATSGLCALVALSLWIRSGLSTDPPSFAFVSVLIGLSLLSYGYDTPADEARTPLLVSPTDQLGDLPAVVR